MNCLSRTNPHFIPSSLRRVHLMPILPDLPTTLIGYFSFFEWDMRLVALFIL
ncbi:MAG: hypothetical protein AB8B58_17575 [Roseobacter sp.]